jgi:hypothetical protein
MVTIPQVAEIAQTILGEVADEAAHETGFVQRKSKMTGAKFVQTLVFGWLNAPDSTLGGLAQTAANLGVQLTPQGIDERFSAEAAACLVRVLAAAVQCVVAAGCVPIPLLQRFEGVYVLDSSAIGLPDALHTIWEGCGNGGQGSRATVKMQARLDLCTGVLEGPMLQAGRAQDRNTAMQHSPLPPGALHLADLGYFSLDVLQARDAQGVYWISRLQVGTAVFDASGQRHDLLALLRSQEQSEVDLPVLLGLEHHLACRLVARREPQDVAEERRRRLKDQARRKGQAVSQARLRLADWTFFITNAPADKLSWPEIFTLAGARWQIELLFKLWKSGAKIDESRSHKPWRILCELYAKLLGVLLQHWLFLLACWHRPDRSLHKAAQTVRSFAPFLAASFHSLQALCQAIEHLKRCLSMGCRMNTRKTKPNTWQLLLAPSPGGLA